MKPHGERTPRRVPNGLNVCPAFKFSITQFTSIYLLVCLAFPFRPSSVAQNTDAVQGVFNSRISRYLNTKVIESPGSSCMNAFVCLFNRSQRREKTQGGLKNAYSKGEGKIFGER